MTILDPLPVEYGAEKAPTFQLYLGSIDPGKGEGYVQATVNIVTTTQHGRAAGAGYEITQTMGGRVWPRAFRLKLVIPRPQAPAPGMTHYTTRAYFKVGSDQVEEGTEAHVVAWFLSLPGHVRRAVELGSTPIVLRGYASTTQPGPANRELSRRRAERVQRILQDVAGSNARSQIFAYGEYLAKTTGEEPIERRVEIDITVQGPGMTAPSPSGP